MSNGEGVYGVVVELIATGFALLVGAYVLVYLGHVLFGTPAPGSAVDLIRALI